MSIICLEQRKSEKKNRARNSRMYTMKSNDRSLTECALCTECVLTGIEKTNLGIFRKGR